MPYADLAEFFANAPLYRVEQFPEIRTERRYGSGSNWIRVPALIDRRCETCGPTKWSLNTDDEMISEEQLSHLRYVCRNCEGASFNIWFYWNPSDPGIVVEKAGQYPKLEIPIPTDFNEALGDKRALYMKGMTLRHNAYGVGALSYFRRVIEDTTDEMLDLLEKSMEETQAAPEAIERLKAAKKGTRFEDKVRIAGEVIPTHLRPGGINPFADLYELLSVGLHDLNDDECCDIVDLMDKSLKFIYTRLKTHAQDAKVYELAAKSLNAKVAKLKSRGTK